MSKMKFDDLEESMPESKPLAAKEIQIGRPTKVKGAKLEKKISCYFTADEKEKLDQERGNTPAATFVRELVLKKIMNKQ